MVEITKKGKLPSEKVYTASCRNCHTQFKFKQGEAEMVYDQRDGNYLKITCPLEGCGHVVTVDQGNPRQDNNNYWDR